jgi:hypothetical protein
MRLALLLLLAALGGCGEDMETAWERQMAANWRAHVAEFARNGCIAIGDRMCCGGPYLEQMRADGQDVDEYGVDCP